MVIWHLYNPILVSFSAAQWSKPCQTKLWSRISVSANLHHSRSKTRLHASKALSYSNEEDNISEGNTSESLAVLEDLNGQEDLELFSENGTDQVDILPKVKKGGRNRKKNDSFVDEAARLAEIDAYLFCGNVR